MIFAEITFCPSINLKKPVKVLVLFRTYRLSCEMRYLILSVTLSLLALKENRWWHFVQRLFFLINISLNIVYALYFSFKFNVSKILALVVILKFEME